MRVIALFASDSLRRMTIQLVLVDGRMRDETSTDHLSADHFAAFLDGRLTGADRERAVRHFTGCAECREELTELRDMLSVARRPSSRRWVVAAAAAVIFAVVLMPRIRGDTAGDGAGRVRTDEGLRLPSGTSAIAVVAPPDQAVVEGRLELSWRSAGVGATYSVTVQDSSGTEVWKRASLVDTSIVVPATTGLAPRSRYFWSVDARLADGSTASTGVRSFVVR